METTEPVTGLADTREQLSRMLIRKSREPVGTDHDDSFPRSTLMRFLLDPRKRVYWIAGAATAAVLLPTLSRAGKLGAMATLATRLTRLISQGR
jgi:hypothetical protein